MTSTDIHLYFRVSRVREALDHLKYRDVLIALLLEQAPRPIPGVVVSAVD